MLQEQERNKSTGTAWVKNKWSDPLKSEKPVWNPHLPTKPGQAHLHAAAWARGGRGTETLLRVYTDRYKYTRRPSLLVIKMPQVKYK